MSSKYKELNLDKVDQLHHLVMFAQMLNFKMFLRKGSYHICKGSGEYIKFEELVSIYNKGTNSKFYSKHIKASKASFVGMCLSIPRKPLTIQRKDFRL